MPHFFGGHPRPNARGAVVTLRARKVPCAEEEGCNCCTTVQFLPRRSAPCARELPPIQSTTIGMDIAILRPAGRGDAGVASPASFRVFAFRPQGGVSVAKSKTDPKLGATRRHEAIDRCAQMPEAPRIASDNPDDDMHEHPTGWPDEFPLEPLPPHPGCDPIEVSTEPLPEHPDRRRSAALRVARSREARPTR